MQILLCLPGNNFPSNGLFNIPDLDKVIHVVLFGALVGFWCYYFYGKKISQEKLKRIFFIIFLLATINGILIEYIQFNFIPFRSFDEGDIIADIIATSVAYGICNVKLLTC